MPGLPATPRAWLSAVFALALALAACVPAEPGEVDPDAPVSSADPPPPAGLPRRVGQGELFGQWRLVSLTGASLAGSAPIHLLIGRARIEAASQCVPFGFAIAVPEPGRVAVRPEPWPDPVCERGRSPAEQAFPRVMAAARRVERRPGGRLAFVGGEGEALVERPPGPVVNPFGNVPGPEPWQMWGAWRLEAVDGAPAASPIDFVFMHRRAEARSGCVSMAWRIVLGPAGAGFARDAEHATCERAPTPDEEALVRILDGEVRIAAPGPSRRRLTGRAGTIVIRR